MSLAYVNGLLSSISDYANSVWSFSDTGSELTSISEPTVAAGTPVWQYAYSGGYMSSESDPNSNQTSFSLDSFHRLSGTTLPGNATTSDTSEQDFGYGSTSSSNPANLTLQSSVSPTTTDANQNTSGYQTNQFGEVVSQTDPYGNTETIQRDANGLPTVITLPPPATGDANPVTDINYNSTGDETSATGAQPTYGTFTYTANSFGQWATFTDITGKEWVRTFDSKGDILSETTPSGMQVTWTYDTYGRLLTMSRQAPNNGTGTVTTQYVYDSDERLIKIIWPDNSTQLFAYSSTDRETSFTDENSHTSGTAYNALGWVTSTTNAANGVTAFTQDLDGNVLTETSPMLAVTSYQWSPRNELLQETLPAPATGDANPVLSWTYDANGKELTATSAMNLTTTYTYDKLNRLASEALPPPAQGQQAPTTTFAYDNLSRKISETNALNATTTWAYANTDISQLTSESLPPPSGSGQGPTTTFGFDSDGGQNTVTDSLNHTTTTAFTVDGQTASVRDNLGHGDTYAYGHGGELLTTTDSLNHSTSDQYDSRYRLVQTTDANNAVTQITLDPAGNETKLVDSDNNATSWTYNAVNLPLTETNSLGTTTTAYNADQMVTSIQDADGRVRDFSYDNLDRLTAEQWMSGGTVVATMSYAYNLDNQLVSASDPNSAYAFTYSGDGNVLSVDNNGTPNVPHVVLTNGYDALGDRTSQSSTIAGTADYLNSYTYNADRQLTVLQQQDQNGGDVISPKEVDFAYNALGQFSSIADYNTLTGPRTDVATGAYSYDGANRLTGLSYTSNAGASTIDTFGWGFDAANNVTSFTSNNGTAGYGYDSTNQLTSASYTTASGGHQPANESYSFTANGNRNMAGYTTGSPNLMTSDGTYNYQYDADGNRTSRTQIASTYSTQYLTTYTWDYRNRLTDVEYYDNNSVLKEHVHYFYDVFDHLIATEVDTTGDGTYNVIDHWALDVSPEIPQAGVPGTALAQPVLGFGPTGNLTTRYFEAVDRIFGDEAVSSLTQGGTNSWDLVNNLGSVVYVLDNTGAVIDQIVYNGFGVVAYESAPSVDHFAGFAGGHGDQNTGLVNNYHRWYDPATGRWLTEDPDGFAAGDPDVTRYVGNEPTGESDATGLWPGGPGFGNGHWTPPYNPDYQYYNPNWGYQWQFGYFHHMHGHLGGGYPHVNPHFHWNHGHPTMHPSGTYDFFHATW